MKELKIGFLQQHNTADTKDNILRLAEGISDLAKRGAQLIVLQELHNSLYFCQTESVDNFDLAEPIPGPSTKLFGELAKQFGVVIVTSLFEKRTPGLYHNTAVVLEKDGSIAGTYRKMHIPDDPAYYEKFYFTPGVLGPVVSRGSPSDGPSGCRDTHLPHCHRLRVERHARGAAAPATRLADRPARTCRRQRTARRHRQPRGLRARSLRPDKRHPVLGHLVRRRPSGGNPLRGIHRRRGEHHRQPRPVALRAGAPLVALPPRPPHRCIRWRPTKVY